MIIMQLKFVVEGNLSPQNIVSQIVGALSSHGASGTVSAEATATVSH